MVLVESSYYLCKTDKNNSFTLLDTNSFIFSNESFNCISYFLKIKKLQDKKSPAAFKAIL
jgi:hypothetical protein